MQPRRGEILLPFVVLAVGGLLIYLGLGEGRGYAWAAGGGFFVVLGMSAILLTMGQIAAGRTAGILRSKALRVGIIALLAAMLVLTVVLGILGN